MHIPYCTIDDITNSNIFDNNRLVRFLPFVFVSNRLSSRTFIHSFQRIYVSFICTFYVSTPTHTQKTRANEFARFFYSCSLQMPNIMLNACTHIVFPFGWHIRNWIIDPQHNASEPLIASLLFFLFCLSLICRISANLIFIWIYFQCK